MRNVITKMLLAAALCVVPFSSIACNTTEGAGKDIKETGKAIERAADDSK